MPSDWERVAADPALTAALRARYTGAGDALDQLWWLDRPGEPAPSGAEDPQAVLERARRELYRPGAPDGRAEEIRRAEAALAADRAAARVALEAALAARVPPPAASSPRLPLRVLGTVAVVAVLAGAGIGAAVVRIPGSAPRALAVLERPQREDDRPPASAPLPAGVPRSSLRHLATSLPSGTALYAGRARDGRVCLVAVVLALDYDAACTTEAAFATAGLSLAFPASVDPESGGGPVPAQEITPSWAPDGRVRF